MKYVDLSLVLYESEQDVSCEVSVDWELVIVPGSLAAGELDTDGWFLVSWSVEGGRSLMAAKYMRNCSMLDCGVKNGLGMGSQSVVGQVYGLE